MDWAASNQCSFRPQDWGKSWMNQKQNTIWRRNFSLFLKLSVSSTCIAWVGCRTMPYHAIPCHTMPYSHVVIGKRDSRQMVIVGRNRNLVSQKLEHNLRSCMFLVNLLRSLYLQKKDQNLLLISRSRSQEIKRFVILD